MLLPALQKFYNALKHLEQFSLDNSFFDNIGSIDVFLSEFRSVTLVLQTSLGGNTHPVYQKNLHQYLIKDVKVAEWLNEERVSVVHKHPFTLKKVVRIIIYSWGNAFEFKRFEQTLEDDRPIGDYKQMIRNTFMSIAAPEINFSAQFLEKKKSNKHGKDQGIFQRYLAICQLPIRPPNGQQAEGGTVGI